LLWHRDFVIDSGLFCSNETCLGACPGVFGNHPEANYLLFYLQNLDLIGGLEVQVPPYGVATSLHVCL
jgi:hypothetical protein